MENHIMLRKLQELNLLDIDKAVLLQSQYIRDHLISDRGSGDCSLQDDLTSLNSLINSKENSLSEDACIIILQEICIPLLKSIHLSFDNRKTNIVLLGQINKIVSSCLYTKNESSFQPLFDLCVKSLQTHVDLRSCTIDNKTTEGILDLHVCLDVLLNLTQKKDLAVCSVFEMKNYKILNDNVFKNLLCVLNHFQNSVVLNLALRCVSNILKNGKQLEYLNSCWELIEKMWIDKRNPERLNIYLCGLSNFFFPVDNVCNINIRSIRTFWEIIQEGSNAENPLTRKQSLYLVKRNVDLCEKLNDNVNLNAEDVPLFWWSKEQQQHLVKVWEDLVMLLETLEETQIHVIKPMLPRLQTLLRATSTEKSAKPLLHTSWLTTIFRRGICHESITLVKWMTEQVLYLDFENCPLIQQGGDEVVMEKQIKKLAAMGILSSISSVVQDSQRTVRDMILSFSEQYSCTTSFHKPISDISHKEWGRIASLFISYQWAVTEYYLSHTDVVNKPVVPTLKVCQDSLSVCGGQNTIPLYRCIRHLLSKCKVLKEWNSIIEALSVSWGHVQGEVKTAIYWDVLEEFIDLTFQPALLQQPRDSSLIEVLTQYGNELMKLGREKTGVANILMKRLCAIWKSLLCTVEGFYNIIGQAAMYGSIFRKQDRQLYDVFAYIESLGKHCSVNELKPHTTKDFMVRAEISSFICSLNPRNGKHQGFAVNLLKELIQQYRIVQEDSFGTITNSFTHRKKHRLLQIVQLLEPFVDKANFELLWTYMWDLLMQENQPSLRHTCEWIIMRMVLKKTDMVEELWNIFDQLTEKKTTVVCSIMCIMSHLGLHLPQDIQESFYSKSFQKLLPWCLANHFNTRVHAAATLLKQWNQCEMLGLTNVMTSHSTTYSCLTFHKESNNYTKNIQRLSENFFFLTFNPVQDFSLETIFQTLPWLFTLPDDEWISPQQFDQVVTSKTTTLPVYNSSQSLKKSTPGSWRFKNPDNALDDSDTEDNIEGDVQKKIMPWRLMLPDDEVQDELVYSKTKRDENGLIVVTSLIDKIPNLGGLCRSSEIFGVSQYVIGKMKYLDDKMFKDLSVTAHKWLPIIEVWPELLPKYLTEKKQEGYTLIGVEQTANSVSLTDFTFPQKSLLLLGNEKEGVPVQLINQLDVCVEIPQQGIIRSLNVHVSGALLIWEYRRQQLVNQM